LLFFGRIHADKGAYEAIQIAKKCKRKLIIAGIIQDGAYFEEKVKPFINDDICYVGSADPKKRDRLLGNAFALLHPINFEEPFGLSVVESFACGTPVVAFDKGSMSEIILDGKNGFLVSTIEEAISAVKNITHINRLFCRKDAEQRFTSQRMVHDYIKAYQMILKEEKKTIVY
jgi:glycosyltransferase involved in cell wall biosynthesis